MKLTTKSTRAGAAIAAAFTFLLAACNPGPKYAKPPATTPSAFKEAVPQDFKEGEGWKIAQPGDDKIRGKWWEMYNDPVLNAIEEQVAVSNQSIIQAEANFRGARAAIISARSSLFPTVTASPSYTNSRFSSTARASSVVSTGGGTGSTTTTGTTGTSGSTTSTGTGTTTTGTTSTGSTGTGTSGTGGSTTTTTTGSTGTTGVSGYANEGIVNTFSLPFDVSYTVDLWHKVRNQVAANTFTAQADAAEIATALLSTQAEVAQDYFQIRALDAERKVLEDTLENYRRSLKLTQTLFQTGIDSEEDVAQAQTQLDTATAQTTDLGVARAQYEHAIAMLIGKPASSFSLPVGEFVPRPPTVPVALPSELLERRPDIAAAERQVAAANAQIGIARAAYYPNLTLSATGGFETSSFVEWFNWPSRFWSLGPQLSQTLLDFGARRAAVEQAQASYDATVANYRQTTLTAFQAVEDNLAALRILSQEVGQEHTAVNSSNHYLDLSLTRYKAGVDSYLNVITAQNTVLTNRETELQIQLRQMTSSVQLIMALGGGWDYSQLPQPQVLSKKLAKNSNQNSGAVKTTNASTTVAAPNPPPLNSTPNSVGSKPPSQ